MSFADVFKRERLQIGYTQQQMADALNTSASTIGMWEQGRRIPVFEKLEEIADFFNIDMEELRGNESTGSSSANRIPVYGKVAAGIPLEMIEDIIDYEEIPAKWGDPSDFFCLQIQGDSMEPRILSGDVVVVKKQADADTGDTVIYSVKGEAASCKRLRKMDDGLMFIPFNNQHDPQIYRWDEVESIPVQILGKVIELRGKL